MRQSMLKGVHFQWHLVFLFVSTVLSSVSAANENQTSDLLSSLRVGHWIEVRGSATSAGNFTADRIELRDPKSDVEIWGVAKAGEEKNSLRVHGRRIEVAPKYHDLLSRLHGERVRVKGKLDGRGHLVAKRLQRRDPGVDRIRGRIDHINRLDNGQYQLEVAGVVIELAPNIREREKVSIQSAKVVLPVALASSSAGTFDTDDLFGDGFTLGSSLHLGINQDITFNDRGNYELDRKNDTDIDIDDDRTDLTHTLRGKLTWAPNARFTGVLDAEHRFRKREIRNEPVPSDSRDRIRTAVFLVRGLPGDVDLAAGRQDFDDPREWLYDQDLDGLRLFRQSDKLNWELSVSTLIDDGSTRNEETLNSFLYVSSRDSSAHRAAYIINRNRVDDRDQRFSHVGLRWIDGKNKTLGSWLDVSYLMGHDDNVEVDAWAIDGGLKWRPENLDWATVTFGYAYATGDRTGQVDNTFRQTGLQDNNGRLSGVSSVRYYGEVFDPELSNMHIATLSTAYRFLGKNSVELIAHSYRQARANEDLLGVDVDRDPNGLDRDLGWEIDLVVSIREYGNWELNLVAGKFEPGSAFGDSAKSAGLVEAQFRVRY